MSYIVPLDKPKCCLECPFKMIECCIIAPGRGEELSIYENIKWLNKNPFVRRSFEECGEDQNAYRT